MKRIDLTGKVFGQWSVLSFIELRNNNSYWLCECSCGNTSEIQRNSLVYGTSTMCVECQRKSQQKDLRGRVFGEWIVLYRNHGSYWLCRCSCGKEKSVFGGGLISGKSTSCGGHKWISLEGQRFGKWTVISFSHTKDKRTFWNCQCDCGNKKIVPYNSLIRGQSKSCGCYKKEELSKRANSFLENRWKYGNYSWYFYDDDNSKINCRSSFEVLFWNYFSFIEDEDVLYEPETFVIDSSTRYTPDFYLPSRDLWIEVKGSFNLLGRSKSQKDKIEYVRNFLNINIEVLFWDDIFEICQLPFKSPQTYFYRAEKEEMKVEDYLARMKYWEG